MTPTEAVLALLANGQTEASIAKAVETTQPTINRIRRGASQPNYALGKALVDLAEALPPVPATNAAA
jgi:predicted transcriptional regulator